MKYFKCQSIIGIPGHVYDNFSEQADVTFACADKLHNPDANMYLLHHERSPLSMEEVEKLKFSCITKDGGL